MTEDFLRRPAATLEHFEVTKALGFTSYMAVPFGTAEVVLGSLTLVSAGSGRRFTADDLSLAEELGEQVAFVVDKERRYEREHRTSTSCRPASCRRRYTGYDDDKIVDILGKTLCKMSPRGHAAALELPLPNAPARWSRRR